MSQQVVTTASLSVLCQWLRYDYPVSKSGRVTNDCLVQKELSWWDTRRSIQVTSPFSNQTFKMYRYDVNNSAPRPESYLAGKVIPIYLSFLLRPHMGLDYTLATSPDSGPTLNETEQAALYAELASGAETGE